MSTKIDIMHLRKADIIVSTGDSKVSKTIRQGTGSNFSHAILYLGNQMVIEAISQGVTERPWEDSKTADGAITLAVALRRRNMDDAARQKVVDAALAYKGRPYDEVGAIGSGMFGNRRGGAISSAVCTMTPILCMLSQVAINNNAKDENADKQFFCSELVSRAFTAAGYPIVDGKATWQTPRVVRTSPYLIYVGHLIGG